MGVIHCTPYIVLRGRAYSAISDTSSFHPYNLSMWQVVPLGTRYLLSRDL